MSPQPAVQDRFGFAHFEESGIPHGLVEAVKYARQRATLLLAPLAGKRADILGNKNLSPDGKAAALTELRRTVGIDLENCFIDATKRAQGVIGDATQKLSGFLFHEVDGPESSKRDALAAARLELFELARDGRRDNHGSAILHDTATGIAILTGGNDAHKLLDQVLTKGSLADAKLLALAVIRSGPISRHLLGGSDVEQAVLNALTARVVEADPAAAEIVANRSHGEHVAAVIRGDRSSAVNVLTRATRLDGSAVNRRHSEDDE